MANPATVTPLTGWGVSTAAMAHRGHNKKGKRRFKNLKSSGTVPDARPPCGTVPPNSAKPETVKLMREKDDLKTTAKLLVLAHTSCTACSERGTIITVNSARRELTYCLHCGRRSSEE